MTERGIWQKLVDSFRQDDLRTTVRKMWQYPQGRLPLREVLRERSLEKRFNVIYKKGLWLSGNSSSGLGSDIERTENLRRALPSLIRSFAIKSIYDAPCGDFNWMKLVLESVDVEYLGADIVKTVVDENRRLYGRNGLRFVHSDLTVDTFPPYDLWICRDCMIHLSWTDTFKALRGFVDSESKYLLATTYPFTSGRKNVDIESGAFHEIDLFLPPYNLPRSVLHRIDDSSVGLVPRELCLWSREQVEAAVRGAPNC